MEWLVDVRSVSDLKDGNYAEIKKLKPPYQEIKLKANPIGQVIGLLIRGAHRNLGGVAYNSDTIGPLSRGTLGPRIALTA